MFQALTGRIKSEVVGLLSKVQVRAEEDVEAIEARRRRSAPVEAVHAALPEAPEDVASLPPPVDVHEDIDLPMEPLRAAGGGMAPRAPAASGAAALARQPIGAAGAATGSAALARQPIGAAGAAPGRSRSESQSPYVRGGRKIGRNEPCPCGSGKKCKKCHGRAA